MFKGFIKLTLTVITISNFMKNIGDETTLKEIKAKLSTTRQTSVSLSTVSRHLHDDGYLNVSPVNTPMLTSEQKQCCIEWTKKYQSDD
jgi:hypothetical protein